MQVNKSNNVSFTGIYKLQFNDKNIKEISQRVIPMYEFIRHEPVAYFQGKNPYKLITDILIDKIAELSGGSKEWLKMNAENHNLKVDLLDDDVCHIITTKKDIESLQNYIVEQATKKLTFMERLKQRFKKPDTPEINENLPLHLQVLQAVINQIKKRNAEFNDFANGKVIEVKTPQELLQKMLTER